MKIVNIGMKWNVDGGRVWQASEVRYAMEHEGWTVLHLEVKVSETEPTVVAVIRNDNFNELHAQKLCHVLRQDCFAVIHVAGLKQTSITGHGELVGPLAEKWGQFDMKRFILPDLVALKRSYMQSTEEYINAQRSIH